MVAAHFAIWRVTIDRIARRAEAEAAKKARAEERASQAAGRCRNNSVIGLLDSHDVSLSKMVLVV